mgnify:CR=1 FL=1
MSINNLTKQEIIDKLQVAEYDNDEMFQTLLKIYNLFEMDLRDLPEGWSINCPEHLGDYVYGKLVELKNNI